MLIGKLNPTCKKALEGAAALCVTKGHYNIELEHFLIKLLEPMDSDLQIILRYYEVDLQTVLKQLMSTIDKMKTGNTTSPVLSKHILSVLEQAWLISSLRLGQGVIRSGSILHALIDADPLRGIILESCPLLLRIQRLNFEKDIDDLLKASKEDFGSSSETSEFVKEIPQGLSSGMPFSSALKDYTENLTLAAQTGKLDPIFGRETEIRQVIDVLSRRFQNNPILVGEAGVGSDLIDERDIRRETVVLGMGPKYDPVRQRVTAGDAVVELHHDAITTTASRQSGTRRQCTRNRGKFDDEFATVVHGGHGRSLTLVKNQI